jgi:hypothetical protein
MPRAVTYSMLLLSAAGTVASLVFFVVCFNADVESVMSVIRTLFVVGFVLGILTNFLIEKLAPKFRDRLLWKGVFRGCPRWMRIGIWVVLISVPFVSLPLALGRNLAGFFVIFAALYSVSFCVTYSFLHATPVARSDKSIPS